VTASRIVGYVDDLERHALHLTEAGTRFFAELSELFRQREKQLVSQLDQEQCDELRELLGRIAQQEGLAPSAHPGYRTDPPKPFG
jgi:DNA-binding MarR family transcriptional regulator